MIKNLFAAALGVAALSGTVSAQAKLSGPFTVTVDLSHFTAPAGKLYLFCYNTVTKTRLVDSAVVEKAPIVFKGELPEPVLGQLRFVPAEQDSASKKRYGKNLFAVYLEPGAVQVVAKDSLSDAVVTGSKTHKDYLAIKTVLDKNDAPVKGLYAQYAVLNKAHDTAGTKRIEAQIDAIENSDHALYKKLFLDYATKSPVALYALNQFAGYIIKPGEVEPLYAKLSPVYRELPSGKAWAEKIEIAKKLEVGQYAIEFTQNDTLGTPVSLSSFKGKYVLLDFWASWCGPCRAENPNVVAAFNKYKEKGFTVLGVSLDQPTGKEKWLKAIHDDGLTWTQVSDLQFWSNAVAKAYAIQSIPQNFLIDPQGKIIAKNVRGEELEKKLAEVFN